MLDFTRVVTALLLVTAIGCGKKDTPADPPAPPKPEPPPAKLVFELDGKAVPMADAKTALFEDGSVLVVVGKASIACEALMPIEPAVGADFVGFYAHLVPKDGQWGVAEIWSQPSAFHNHRSFDTVIVTGDPKGPLSVKLDFDMPAEVINGDQWHHVEVHGTIDTTPCGIRKAALPS